MSAKDFLLALDQGTSSSRAFVFDRYADVLSVAQQPTTQFFPHAGWVNQDPDEIWRTTVDVGREALTKAGIGAHQVAAIGIANQRETLVVWDAATGRPVAPAIVWQSRQSQPQVDSLSARGMTSRYHAVTGLVPDAYFTATKIAWLLENDQTLRARAEAGELRAGTVDSWLIWNLTGGIHATDPSNASRTMLYDIVSGEWSAELLADLRVPVSMLPAVVPSTDVVGTTLPELFGAAIPIAGVAGDQQAALFGQACFSPGDAKNTYGTGSFLLMNTGTKPRPSSHQLLTTIAWQIDRHMEYALEGAVYVSGAAVQWLRDGLGILSSAADIESLARSVPDSEGVMFVPALTGLGAPHWDPSARGVILGLTRGSTAAHLARATLDAIALQTRDVTDAMSSDAHLDMSSLRVDGGAARNDLLLQIQADVLGVPVVRPRNIETTALGAAYLAGLGSGLWSSTDELKVKWQIDRVFEPGISRDERDARYATWQRAVERSFDWATGT